MRHFKSMQEIKEADVQTLMQIPEIPEHIAEEIVKFFAH